MENHEEIQYLNLIKDIIENGSYEEGRNGKTLTKFGVMMKYSLKDGTLPLFTTKKVKSNFLSLSLNIASIKKL